MVLSDKVEVLVDDAGQSLRFEHFSTNSSVFSFLNFFEFRWQQKNDSYSSCSAAHAAHPPEQAQEHTGGRVQKQLRKKSARVLYEISYIKGLKIDRHVFAK